MLIVMSADIIDMWIVISVYSYMHKLAYVWIRPPNICEYDQMNPKSSCAHLCCKEISRMYKRYISSNIVAELRFSLFLNWNLQAHPRPALAQQLHFKFNNNSTTEFKILIHKG